MFLFLFFHFESGWANLNDSAETVKEKGTAQATASSSSPSLECKSIPTYRQQV